MTRTTVLHHLGPALGAALLLVLATAAPTHGQDHSAMDHAEHEGYVDETDRDIASLAPEAVEALLAGEGMGYALPAELNRYPGPRHVLDLREQLDLEPAQIEAIEGIFAAMNQRARALGAELVEAEQAVDALFSDRTADSEKLREALHRSARLEAELRLVHLEAHLETTARLSDHQIHAYGVARGYEPRSDPAPASRDPAV